MPARDTPDTQRVGPSAEPTPAEIYSTLARELRSPLSTVAGYLELLANGGVGPITEEQHDFLAVVRRNVHRLTLVVDDWLELSRLESGRVVVSREAVALDAVLSRALEDLRAAIDGKHQQVSIELPEGPVQVLADTRAVYRIVSNLLSNAHKYTQPGGSIRLRIAVETDGMVRLDVADSGIGIREEDQPLLFRKFYRVPLTEAEPGTGLGLTLTRILVEHLGGSISVQSALGQGATFTVRLPHALAANSAPPPSEDASIATAATAPVASACT
ncbi:MAG: HAMP domain-containing histidine kinase [Gemmataceae bacterium]|nr:HAMP domain-containing histidine kinase [Gemmataceae bacterium]